MDFIPQYIKGKNASGSRSTYDCPQLEPILKPTLWLYRLSGAGYADRTEILPDIPWDEAIFFAEPCPRRKLNVMAKERQAFVYGNEAEGVPGCIANGIDEKIANKIYDEMMDFAKYAFNKSHAAAYAVCYVSDCLV